jgi:hypothetical protein
MQPLHPNPRSRPLATLPRHVAGAPHLSPLEALGERIAQLSAEIHAATYQLLVMLRDFDERGGWNSGFHTCAHWLNWRTGLDLGAAREKVRVARALAELPAISAAMERGEVSFSKVRALTRIATPANETELLHFAKAGTAHHVERLVRGWRRIDRSLEREQDERRHASRYLRLYTDEDGMVVLRARLTPEAGAALVRALEAGEQQLYDAARETRDEHGGVPIEQRWADALGLVAESALAAGLDPGTRGDRYQVVVHVDAEALPAGSETGSSALDDGTHVAAETCRRIACDAALVVMRHDKEGNALDVGRRRRTIPPALRRALDHRDPTCRFPGCRARCGEGHHVEHWADGGETKLGNLVKLCRRHHRAVHEEGFRVEMAPAGAVRFYRPDGRSVEEAPALPRVSGSSLDRLLGAWAVSVNGAGTLPSWDGGHVEYTHVIDGLHENRDRGCRRGGDDDEEWVVLAH